MLTANEAWFLTSLLSVVNVAIYGYAAYRLHKIKRGQF